MIKIAVFEDNHTLRKSLFELLDSFPDMHCIGSWENASQVSKIMQHYQPDVVLMDIDMPETDGMEGLKIIHSQFPSIPVIMLTIFDDDASVFNSICYGAKGYLLKKTAPDKMYEAIIDVVNGGSSMSPAIARKVMQAFAVQNPIQNESYGLTKRETEMLQSLVAGNSYKMIGNELGISINTVRQYIRKVYEKLEVHSMNEAVAKAIKEKIV